MRLEYVTRQGRTERVRVVMAGSERGLLYDAVMTECERLDHRGYGGSWRTARSRNARKALPAFQLLRDGLHVSDDVMVVSKRDITRLTDALFRESQMLANISDFSSTSGRAEAMAELRAVIGAEVIRLSPDLAETSAQHDANLEAGRV